MVFDMQDMDTIRFDDKGEIERIIFILNEWQSEHGSDAIAQEMVDMLNDIWHGSWD